MRRTLSVLAAGGALAILALSAHAKLDNGEQQQAAQVWHVNRIHAAEGGQ